MIKNIFKLSLILFITLITSQVFSQKQRIIKKDTPLKKPLIHPYNHLLTSSHTKSLRNDKAIDNNKLLVILVDFQEETTDNPLTTGNGKFLLEPDLEYRTTIASPPHNQEYFEANLDALRYFYLAASQNDFNLEYDVYPKDMPAYTLPEDMSYYNPINAGSALFISRIEEYFKDSFELADSLDPEIDFSLYGHFMIIHAGSDWQHDVFGDSPEDLPSFFIRVAPGKEAIVDSGSVLIDHACNVPSTISQDFDTYEINGDTYYTGYGALNGVMAHEFGHSLGAVDLYNVYTSAPMVGVFDIMDSGGSGITEDPGYPGVLIEGELPSLPGAFTRAIMFDDSFQQRGLFKDVNQLLNQYDLSDLIQVSASSQRQQGTIIPNLIKFSLNENEYILIENRSVDPDNDGGTAIKGALDGRVALYPTSFDDPDDTPTYEYDYLLPSFIDEDFNAIGGGLLVWHVDENLLMNQGQTDSDGLFVSNLDNNTVNINYSHRGVRVIEADGLNDIGNIYSWYWTGTPYEYFHTYKPDLDNFGWFQNWTTDFWRPTLDSNSEPPLLDYDNQPSFYGLNGISQPNAIMNFKLSAGMFDAIQILGNSDPEQIPLPILNSPLTEHILPVCRNDSLHFYLYSPEMGINEWSELINPIPIINHVSFEPVLADANNNDINEVILPDLNSFDVIEFGNDAPTITTIVDYDFLTTSPLYAFGTLYVATTPITGQSPFRSSDKTYSSIGVWGDKLAATDSALVVLRNNSLLVFNPSLDLIIESYILPEICDMYEPVIVQDSLSEKKAYYVISNSGNIYMCSQNKIKRIFINDNQDNRLTNLAVCPMGEFSPCLIFAQNNKIYALKQDGTMLTGYPIYLENYSAKPLSHIKVSRDLNFVSGNSSVIIYITLDNGGFLAVSTSGDIDSQNSIIDIKNDRYVQVHYIQSEEEIFWFFVNNDDYLMATKRTDVSEYPLLWSGFRNGTTGHVKLRYLEPNVTSDKINAFIFPSPVKTNRVSVRIENPDGLIKLHVYDITGKLIFRDNYETHPVTTKDILLDISKYSSGVYIVTLENNGQTKRIKFAVEK